MSKEYAFCSPFCHLPALLLPWSMALRPSPDPSNQLRHRPEILPSQNCLDTSSGNGTALLQCRVERKAQSYRSRADSTLPKWLLASAFSWKDTFQPLNRCSFELSFVSVLTCNPWLDLRQSAQAFPSAMQSPRDRSFCSSKLSLAAPFHLWGISVSQHPTLG